LKGGVISVAVEDAIGKMADREANLNSAAYGRWESSWL
jgi:hypothetical protein